MIQTLDTIVEDEHPSFDVENLHLKLNGKNSGVVSKGLKNSELLEKWAEKAKAAEISNDYFDITSCTRTQNGIPYNVILNPGRINRLKNRDGKKIPTYDEEITKYYRCQQNNFIFGEEYYPYFISINIFPIMRGHLTIMHKEPNRFFSLRRSLEKSDLEIMLRFCNDTGVRVFHNMLGLGASQPDREHFQGMCDAFPIEFADKKNVSRESQVYFMPDYPGSNIIFRGNNKIDRTLYIADTLHKRNIAHGIILVGNDIYVIPIKTDKIEGYIGRVGCFELGGSFVAVNENEFKEYQEEGIDSVLRKVLFPANEYDIKNLF